MNPAPTYKGPADAAPFVSAVVAVIIGSTWGFRRASPTQWAELLKQAAPHLELPTSARSVGWAFKRHRADLEALGYVSRFVKGRTTGRTWIVASFHRFRHVPERFIPCELAARRGHPQAYKTASYAMIHARLFAREQKRIKKRQRAAQRGQGQMPASSWLHQASAPTTERRPKAQ